MARKKDQTDWQCRRSPLRWCSTMDKYVEGSMGKGLRTVVVLNLEAKVGGKDMTRCVGVRYMPSAKGSETGTMLNQCPWCLADLRWWIDDEKAVSA